MMRNILRVIKKGGLEIFYILIIYCVCGLTISMIGHPYWWYPGLFEEKLFLPVITFVILDIIVALFLWRGFWYTFIEKQKVSKGMFLLLSIALSYFLSVNIIGGLCLMKDYWIYLLIYVVNFTLFLYVYWLIYLWRRYDQRAQEVENEEKFRSQILYNQARKFLLITLAICSFISLLLFYVLIFS